MNGDDGQRWAFLVEGHGEVTAVPNLVRAWFPSVTIAPPIRVSKDLILRSDVELARYTALASRLCAYQAGGVRRGRRQASSGASVSLLAW